MKCPICGCKMKEEFMCPFCKITGEQVRNASNKEAIKRIKTKDTKEVYTSSYLPKDVNNTRLMLTCLFGGAFGVHQFYTGKYKTGFFYLFSFFYSIITYVLSEFIYKNSVVLEYFKSAGLLIAALIIFLWISDFFKICFKAFPIPVVLAEIEYKKKEKRK